MPCWGSNPCQASTLLSYIPSPIKMPFKVWQIHSVDKDISLTALCHSTFLWQWELTQTMWKRTSSKITEWLTVFLPALGIKPKVLGMLPKFHQWAIIPPSPKLSFDPLFHPKKYNIHIVLKSIEFCNICNLLILWDRLNKPWFIYLMNTVLCIEKERWFLHIAKSHLFTGWKKKSKGECYYYSFEGLTWKCMFAFCIHF